MSRSELPNSVGGWVGQMVEYNQLGQAKRQSVPTEVNGNWTPSGDDAVRGWLWTAQRYDWKGRVVRKINTDGADTETLNASDKLITYTGCGCAGGQVTTIQSELVSRDDIPTQTARRTQKVYSDILGRTYKTETLKLDGSVYSTNKTTFNGRDQVTLSRQFSGTENSATFQDTTATYDGFGRLKTQHRPEQNAGTATIYNYNSDDSISSVADARGAVKNYGYNPLTGLLVGTSSTVPSGSGIPVTPTFLYTYNNLGLRTSMYDGIGHTDYVYNNLGQMTSETRQFSDNLPDAPQAHSSFKLEYSYSLTGQLKSYKEPYGLKVNYAQDKVGRLNSVTGNLAGSVINYATNPTYTARGNLTHLDYGNGTSFNISNFNNKLQPTNYELKHGAASLLSKQYEYYDDGQLKKEKNLTHPDFDRLYVYDHQSRMTQALTGIEANGQIAPPTPPIITPTTPTMHVPYHYEMQYNAFGNQTQTTTRRYIGLTTIIDQAYLNNRKVTATGTPYSQYDAEGNETYDQGWFRYDVNGQLSAKLDYQTLDPEGEYYYDGDGKMLKRTVHEMISLGTGDPPSPNTYSVYSIYSSVLGEEITHADEAGNQFKGVYIRANGTTIAIYNSQYQSGNVWSHKDVATSSVRSTLANGTLSTSDTGAETDRLELDPTGNSIGFDPLLYGNFGYPSTEGDLIGGFPKFTGTQGESYTFNGIRVPQSFAEDMILSAGNGGIFGLLERSARLSATRVKLGAWWRTWTFDLRDSEGSIIGGNTVTHKLYDVYGGYASNSWAVNWSFFQTKDLKDLKSSLFEYPKTQLKNTDELKKDVNARLEVKNGDASCREKLDELLKELGSKYASIDALANKFLGGGFKIFNTKNFQPKVKTYNSKTKKWFAENAQDGETSSDGQSIIFNTQNSGETSFVFLHELLHAAGKGAAGKGLFNDFFKHEEIQKAIDKIDPTLSQSGLTGINHFISKYCDKKETKK